MAKMIVIIIAFIVGGIAYSDSTRVCIKIRASDSTCIEQKEIICSGNCKTVKKFRKEYETYGRWVQKYSSRSCQNGIPADCSRETQPVSPAVVTFTALCPSLYPFAYRGGEYCCKYNQEKFDDNKGELCDGSVISLASGCCKDDAYTRCPAGGSSCRSVAQPVPPAEVSTASPTTLCPSSHPFAYRGGEYCCKLNREKVDRSKGALCDGSVITLASRCCKDDAYTRCPAGGSSCRNGEPSCPSSHPFAYRGGEYCCGNNREKVDRSKGEGCDGSVISLNSVCCKDDAYTKCPAGGYMCANTEAQLAASPTASCPSSHPFAYRGGEYCCKYNQEKVDRSKGEVCDGSVITLESVCCKGDAYTRCPSGSYRCRNREDEKMEKEIVDINLRDNVDYFIKDNKQKKITDEQRESADENKKNIEDIDLTDDFDFFAKGNMEELIEGE